MKLILKFLFLFLIVSSQHAIAQCEIPQNAICGTGIDPGGTDEFYWYWVDADGDGIGNDRGTSNPTDGKCFINTPNPPPGYSTQCGDCNDNNPNIQTAINIYFDADGDGDGTTDFIFSCFPTGNYRAFNNLDCDDTDPTINHLTKWYRDADNDGFGDPNNFQTQCQDPSGGGINYVLNNNDCDDTDGTTTTRVFYLDNDGDGFGNSNISTTGCEPIAGYVFESGDCDDDDPLINPETRWYIDNDGDGFGNHNGQYVEQCEKPIGYVFGEHDCNDNNAGIHPNTIWYLDSDDDGYGDSSEDFLMQCSQPNDYVLSLSPITPVPAVPNPTYSSLDVNDLTYKESITPLISISSLTELSNLPNEEKTQQRTYYDGMGRPIQNIDVQQGGFQEDIIQYIEYDRFGRAIKQYLPYAKKQTSTPARYSTNALSQTKAFYQNGTIKNSYVSTNSPFSESVFDRSPRNRMASQSSPGNSWAIGNGNEVEMDYKLNSANDVRLFKVELSPSFQPTLIDDNSYYDENELTITIVKDENWVNGVNNTAEEYKNKEGLTILKRTYVDGIRLSTYYVYDDFGNLTYVIPPKAEPDANPITTTILNKLCFQYKYDGQRRQVAKSKPDVMGWERVIYDSEDRPILVKDPNLSANGKWLFTKYDQFGRVVYTGLYTPTFSKTPEELQSDADARGPVPQQLTHSETRGSSSIAGVSIGYTNNVFPTQNIELLTVNYYDDYTFQDIDKPTTPSTIFNQSVTTNVKGLPVANWSRTIDNSTWSKTYSYYNEKATLIQSHHKNHLGGYTIVETEVDYRQKVTFMLTKHKRTTSHNEIVIQSRFIYDQAERVKASYQKINNDVEKLINGFVYDGIGQVLVKYIEPESEDFGFEMVTSGRSEEKGTFTTEVAGNWQLTTEKGATMESKNQKMQISLQYDGTGVVGFYDLQAGVEYKIAADLSLSGMTAFLDFGIWFGSTQLYTSTVTDSGVVETFFTPTQSGTHSIGFILNGNPSETQQTFTIDNTLVQERDVAPVLVQQLKDMNALQTIDYQYNARGWLTQINNPDKVSNTYDLDVFGYKINYDEVEGETGLTDKFYKPYFNGNITQVFWATSNDNQKRSYRYRYDALNRIKKATFSDSNYNLEDVKYDKNGNITELDRNLTGSGYHNFDYSYDGNQLHSLGGTISDTNGTGPVVRSYSYDDDGNMITDSSKGIIDIEYNFLNQPERVVFATGEIIEYDYEASGRKLQKRFIQGNLTLTTDYLSGFQYDNGTLQFLPQPEGYVVQSTDTNGNEINDYVYNYTDHLGNVRLSYSDTDRDGHIDIVHLPDGTRPTNEDIDGDGDFRNEIVNENNYYPFGLQHKGYNTTQSPLATVYKYGFNGKELQEENSIAWLDFGSRNYDAELGRWFNTDPQNQFGSPYLYAFNNPISSVDPDGEFAFTAGIVILGGAIVGGVTTAISNPSADFGDIFNGSVRGFMSSTISHGVGELSLGVIGRASVHGITSGGFDALQGGDFWQSSGTAFVSSLAGSALSNFHPAIQIGGSGVIGGFVDEAQGGSFVEGFATGLTIAAFNHSLHRLANSFDNTEPTNKYKRYFRQKSNEINNTDYSLSAIKSNQTSGATSVMNITSKGLSLIGSTLLQYDKFSTFVIDGTDIGVKHIRTVRSLEFTDGVLWRNTGRLLSSASLFFTYNAYSEGRIDGVTAGYDAGFTLYGVLGGPFGWGLSGMYSIFNIFIPYDHRMQVMTTRAEKAKNAKTHEEAKRIMGSCFIKGTKILMANMTEKNIENIKVGDKIMSVDINKMKLEPDNVIAIPNELKKYRIIEAKFSNGTVNKFSPAHPYWVKGKGWCVFDLNEAKTELKFNVNKMEKGDVVYFYENGNLKETKIISLYDTGQSVIMYNVEHVEKNHTFFANNILVHNKRID